MVTDNNQNYDYAKISETAKKAIQFMNKYKK